MTEGRQGRHETIRRTRATEAAHAKNTQPGSVSPHAQTTPCRSLTTAFSPLNTCACNLPGGSGEARANTASFWGCRLKTIACMCLSRTYKVFLGCQNSTQQLPTQMFYKTHGLTTNEKDHDATQIHCIRFSLRGEPASFQVNTPSLPPPASLLTD